MIELVRMWFTPKSSQGVLYVDGKGVFTTLEPDRDSGMLIIPATYQVEKAWSNRFQKITPHLQAVPGHTFIEMHWGNAPEDTHGCILLGLTRALDWVGDSRSAFAKFMALVPDHFEITITERLGGNENVIT